MWELSQLSPSGVPGDSQAGSDRSSAPGWGQLCPPQKAAPGPGSDAHDQGLHTAQNCSTEKER